ncbi:MAG: hypothetical protein U0670_11310 [Anaerolineae bacterium]
MAGRRWGPSISGLLVGLPLTSGPIAFFLSLNNGVSFASAAAMGTLAGTLSQAAFCVVYSRSAFRFNWIVAIFLSSLAFIASTVVLQFLYLPLIPLYLLVLLCLVLALRFSARVNTKAAVEAKQLPNWDIPARMIVATTYVVLLTSIAPHVGAHLTGLLSPFPLYAAVLAAFAHRLQGPEPAIRVVYGLLIGLFGFASFFLVLSGLLPPVGIVGAFSMAAITVLTIQAVALWVLRRSTHE